MKEKTKKKAAADQMGKRSEANLPNVPDKSHTKSSSTKGSWTGQLLPAKGLSLKLPISLHYSATVKKNYSIKISFFFFKFG